MQTNRRWQCHGHNRAIIEMHVLTLTYEKVLRLPPSHNIVIIKMQWGNYFSEGGRGGDGGVCGVCVDTDLRTFAVKIVRLKVYIIFFPSPTTVLAFHWTSQLRFKLEKCQTLSIIPISRTVIKPNTLFKVKVMFKVIKNDHEHICRAYVYCHAKFECNSLNVVRYIGS